KTGGQLGIYDYLELGSRGGMPIVCPRAVARSIKIWSSAGAKYYATQSGTGFALAGINYFVAMRLLWNPELDVEEVLEEFYSTGFGAAADVIRDFFDMFEKRWE